MTEPAAEKIMQRVDDVDSKKIPADVGEGAFPRLQERTQTQLGFINNLLVTLAVALLAFAVNALANSTDLDHGWRKVTLFLGLMALALSVLAGLRLAFNRLASHRITTRVARLRQLRDRYASENGSYELRQLRRQAVFCMTWARRSLSKRAEKQAVRAAAKALAGLIPDASAQITDTAPGPVPHGRRPGTPDVSQVTAATTRLVESLRTWYERADDWTWVWLRAQTWLFIAGGLLLLAGPVSYYLLDHAVR
jgi:hypothetical protein